MVMILSYVLQLQKNIHPNSKKNGYFCIGEILDGDKLTLIRDSKVIELDSDGWDSLNKNIGIIGGGITGVICAIFLAKEGNKVTIFERKELLGETSSRTYKLLHGGIRYLENLQLSEVNGLNDRYWWLENFPDSTKKIEIMIL